MIDVFRFRDSTALTTPRRVVRYVLVLCTSGSATITVDEDDFELYPNDVITITSGQIHYSKKLAQAEGFILEFTLDFFCKDDKDIELIFHNGLFCHFAMNEVIRINNDFIEKQLLTIQQELNEKPYQYLTSVHSRIELILVEINRAKITKGDEIWKPDALFLKFLEAVRDNFEKDYSVSQFAEMLQTTEIKLNELAKIHTGKTAQNVIYSLVVSEAKRLLIYENLSVKEVAFKLGFSDPFYFSNFFKKQTNVSPKLYKERHSI